MVWRFRYYLAKENASALPKFCKVVDWERPEQEKEATAVMQMWLTPPADVALELLTHEFSTELLAANAVPRDFAISILDQVRASARLLFCCTPLSGLVGVSIGIERGCQPNDRTHHANVHELCSLSLQ